jgi:hypothetical protein
MIVRTPILFFLTVISSLLFGQNENELFLPVKLSLNSSAPISHNFHLSNRFYDKITAAQLFNLPFDTNKSKLKKSKPVGKNKYKIVPLRLTLVGAGLAGTWAAMHVYYKNTWWKDQRKFFKFAQDGYYARDIDKISHIYTSDAFTEITAIAYEWSGIPPRQALIFGAITTMAYETYIEVNDGFAPIWGFDWEDVGANLFGALYPFLQREIPVLKNFNFKWSFRPEWISKKSEKADDLLDDYTNMTFWLSVSPEGLLPKNAARYYPGFLALALGLSIKNASHVTGSGSAYHEWYLSFDYDLTKFPGNTEFLKNLKKILNFYHFPAPAVRISPSGIWYGLYF